MQASNSNIKALFSQYEIPFPGHFFSINLIDTVHLLFFLYTSLPAGKTFLVAAPDSQSGGLEFESPR